MLVTPYHDHWDASMTDAIPFAVVCVADNYCTTERVDLVENTFVAFVMAEMNRRRWRQDRFRQRRVA